jgi:hypothetical protein
MTTAPDTRAEIPRALLLAALLLVAVFAVKHLSPDYLSPDAARRVLAMLPGVPAIYYANAVPKYLRPILGPHCDAAAEQALRRFVGWTLMLGSLGYVAASAFAPWSIADDLAAGLLGAAVLVVLTRLALVFAGRRHA